MSERRKYNNLDGLRVFAAVGVLMMHVRANIFKMNMGGFMSYLVDDVIGSMGNFVQLFFMLSGFAMCCGYYEKVKENKLSLNKFYGKRYVKILPFFLLLSLVDVFVALVMDGFSLTKFYEVFANATLMFGLFTQDGMSVIGVGWTLGVIFAFYILFPFFVYMLWTKKRAWIALAVTLGISFLNTAYFGMGRALAFSWMCYFVVGGLIYLYRDKIAKWLRHPAAGTSVAAAGFTLAFCVKIPTESISWGGGHWIPSATSSPLR